MTLVLGLGLGHDASAAVLRDGVVLAHVLRERHSGVRHHLGIDRATIERALDAAGVGLDEIDAVAVTATQQSYALIDDADYLAIEPRAADAPDPARQRIDNPWWRTSVGKLVVERWRRGASDADAGERVLEVWSRTHRLPMDAHRDWEVLGILSPMFGPAGWLEPFALDEMPARMTTFLGETLAEGALPSAFHFPLRVRLGGRELPGWFINHHMAHAASSFSCAPAERALVFTHDGGTGSDSGFAFLAIERHLFGIGPHFLECGQFYDYVAERLGLGTLGGAGKLMGLASYGTGRLEGILPIGTRVDWRRWAEERGAAHDGSHLYAAMFDALLDACVAQGWDPTAIGDASRVLDDAPREVAHAVQRQLELTIEVVVTELAETLEDVGLGEYARNVCLSGGVALNCPANSRLWNTGRFETVHIEPHCEDGGLSIGGAWYVQSQLLGGEAAARTPLASGYGMLGPGEAIDLDAVLASHAGRVRVERIEDWARSLAADVAADLVVGVYEGGYETGPRALGHRSILAKPSVADNWRRVNVVKGRELWRPFAPVVREEDLYEWFEAGPPSSPFMLFTYRVRDDRAPLVPAITHVDRTSRVQTVTAADGALHACLGHLRARGETPVVLNTSFNGPGRPIVQRAGDALEMLLVNGLDVVYLDGVRIARAA